MHVAEDLGRLLHILGTTVPGVELALFFFFFFFCPFLLQESARIAMARAQATPTWALMFVKHTPRCFTKSA